MVSLGSVRVTVRVSINIKLFTLYFVKIFGMGVATLGRPGLTKSRPHDRTIWKTAKPDCTLFVAVVAF